MSAVRVAIAGSSGSVGTQTLDVVRAEAGRYEVVGGKATLTGGACRANPHMRQKRCPAGLSVPHWPHRSRAAGEGDPACRLLTVADQQDPAAT